MGFPRIPWGGCWMPLEEHETLLLEKQGRGGEHTGRSSGL